MNRANRGEQKLRIRILEHESAGSRTYGPCRALVEIERRQHQNSRWSLRGREDLLGRRYAVEHRHPDVHQHHVRHRGCGELHCLSAVARLADELEIGLRGDEHPNARAEELLVVDQRDSDAIRTHFVPFVDGVVAGSHAVTVHDEPSSDAVQWPPERLARSFIPAMP